MTYGRQESEKQGKAEEEAGNQGGQEESGIVCNSVSSV
jgi:hypothetical protein